MISVPRHPGRRAFTLTELLVAVLVLIAVIVATSKIFGTISRVTGVGGAGSAVLQEAAAIERLIRADLDRLSREGFFAIRNVAVRNDVNLASGGPLLNPALRPGAIVRADQLVFFAQGVESVQTLRGDAGANRKAQGSAARIYYGPAFQVPEGPRLDDSDAPDTVWAIDPKIVPGSPIVPWSWGGSRDFVRTRFRRVADGTDYSIDGDYAQNPVVINQPAAPQWLLARQAIVLADDGGDTAVFLGGGFGGSGGVRTTGWIFDPVVRHGRVDAAASELSDLRQVVTVATSGGLPSGPRPWFNRTFTDGDGNGDQWGIIGDAVFYPRAERVPPSMNRVDQALTNHVLAAACSSFAVDWTYETGTGFADAANPGLQVDLGEELPWFGMPDAARGVLSFRQYLNVTGQINGRPIFYENLEPSEKSPPELSPAGTVLENLGATVYEAFFGYNEDVSLDSTGSASLAVGYTPWPSAIRITMVLHDAAGELESGRIVQFVIDLPRPR